MKLLCIFFGIILLLPGDLFSSETLAEVYRIYGVSCVGGLVHSGTAFRLVGRQGFFTALHTVNGCGSKVAVRTPRKDKSDEITLALCAVAIDFDVAVLDVRCDSSYNFSFTPPNVRDETLYVIGYPIRANQLQRPVFLFLHGDTPFTRLDELGLDSSIFGREGKGMGLARSTPVITIGSSIAPGDSGAPLITIQEKSSSTTKEKQVIGIVGGGIREDAILRSADGRRESGAGGLVGITWATILGPELGRAFANPTALGGVLGTIAKNQAAQFFSDDAFRKFIKGVEFVEVPALVDRSVRRYWVMASEATQRDFNDCVHGKKCTSRGSYDLNNAGQVALFDRFKDAKTFCEWFDGGSLLDQAVWETAASQPQVDLAEGTVRDSRAATDATAQRITSPSSNSDVTDTNSKSGGDAAPSDSPTPGPSDRHVPYAECQVNLKGFTGCRDHQGPLSVRATKPNRLGIYDLWGNVWEWLQTPGSEGVVAGGAFNTPYREMSCTGISNCAGAVRSNARAGTKGARCMVPIDDSTEPAPVTRD